MRKWMLRVLLSVGLVTFVGCSNRTSFVMEENMEDYELASTTPFGKYPELVTYTLGKMSGANNSNMPLGDTYEDNAYTRYLREMLNIQNIDAFEESTDYDNVVSMAITAEDLPDVMVISDQEQLQTLVEKDLIEDLTEVYENCTSDTIKEIYESYGEDIIENVTIDGKIMAMPETNIENGPSLLWLRQDWMDKLGLEAPKTLKDAEYIIKQFIEKDPGNNGEGRTVGLACVSDLVGEAGYSFEYQLDIIFANYGAFPKQWIYNKSNELVYGSVQPETKKALKKLHNMYTSGILDSQFLLRSSENIIDLIVNGRCGSFFGPWWAPNNPLINAKKSNPDADWVPYLISTNSEGSTCYISQNPSYKYVVVRKGYEHPEIVMKIISVLFDYVRYQEPDAKELARYYQLNVDPTARPLAINVDFADALKRCYRDIQKVFQGKLPEDELELLEASYYNSCKAYMEEGEHATLEDWAAYTSRITACGVIEQADVIQVKSEFFGETDTMKQEWWKLKKLEEKTYLQIITGETSIDSFDEFVVQWKEQGGATITQEVRNEVKN